MPSWSSLQVLRGHDELAARLRRGGSRTASLQCRAHFVPLRRLLIGVSGAEHRRIA